MDVDNIDAGRDFVKEVHEWIPNSDIVLCVIGKHWIALDENGKRRLDLPGDFVRLEIETALDRAIPVIPVLVADAQMPGPDVLPDSIAGLCHINAHRMNHGTWDNDIAALKKAIQSEIARARKRGISKLGKDLPRLTDTQIVTKWLNDQNPPTLMGRNRGLNGSLLREDIETGRWKIQYYDVAAPAEEIEPPANWLRVTDFIERAIPSALKEPEVLEKAEEPMPGRTIYELYKAGRNAPLLMSRIGALKGKAIEMDIRLNRWKKHRFEVSYSTMAPPRNWFRVEDFVAAVDASERSKAAD